MQEVAEARAPYEFPFTDDRVAQEPPEARGGSRSDARLLVVDRDRDTVAHRGFTQFSEFLHDQDVLVLNNARVIPSLLYGKDADGREVAVNILALLLYMWVAAVWYGSSRVTGPQASMTVASAASGLWKP